MGTQNIENKYFSCRNKKISSLENDLCLELYLCINPFPADTFHLENVVCILSLLAYNQNHFRLVFVMAANTMNPDQTAPPKGAV